MDIVNINANYYPSINEQTTGSFVVLAVLVKRVDGYRVYQAIVPDTSMTDPEYLMSREWVAAWGGKASFEDARRNFPQLSEKEYAR